MPFSRRSFLYGCGAALAGLGVASVVPETLVRRGGRRLLVLLLRGGNDGLQTVIPHGDPDYGPEHRPTLYVPFHAALDLNGFASLHPALESLAEPFRAGELAIVHRVGYPNTRRSHLESRRVWEGWLDRYAEEHAVAPGLDDLSSASLFPVSAATNAAGFSPSSFAFFRSVKECARSLVGGARIARAELPGWDTHAGQGRLSGPHPERLSWLAHALRSLRVVLADAAIWDETIVVTLSEFGRSTKENEWGGTDHGAASCLFVAGGGVRGGVYNCDAATWPRGVMFAVDGRALLHRTDYRAVIREILRDHMGASPASLQRAFPGDFQELGLVHRRWFA